MLKEDQKIKILWNPKAYSYFKEKGYKNWRKDEYIYVSPDELPLNSSREVTVICDGENCGKEINMSYKIYNKRIKKHNDKYFCRGCVNKDKDFIKYRIEKKEEKRRKTNLEEEREFWEKANYNPSKNVSIQLLFLNSILRKIGDCGIASFLATKENVLLINKNNFYIMVKILFQGNEKRVNRDFYECWLKERNSILLINIKDMLPKKEDVIKALETINPGDFKEIYSKEFKKFQEFFD